MTFDDIAKAENGIKQNKLRGFFINQGFDPKEVAGNFSADIKAELTVFATIVSYGVTPSLTVAAAIPYFVGKSEIEAGFRPENRARQFVDSLSKPDINRADSSIEAADKLSNAVEELNKKLTKNGFKSLGKWEKRGIGDTIIATKYQLSKNSQFRSALTSGFAAPTGQVEDPDELADIGFGDGSWDLFAGISSDMLFLRDIFLNSTAKYTHQIPNTREVRLSTEDEPIEVSRAQTMVKQGDFWDLGASIQYEPVWGAVGGIGYLYQKKLADSYDHSLGLDVRSKLENGTSRSQQEVEYKLGYSSLNAFKRNAAPLPFIVELFYKKQIASINTPVTDFFGLDANVFF